MKLLCSATKSRDEENALKRESWRDEVAVGSSSVDSYGVSSTM